MNYSRRKLLLIHIRSLYKWAAHTISLGIQELLVKAQFIREDINWFIPKSPNQSVKNQDFR